MWKVLDRAFFCVHVSQKYLFLYILISTQPVLFSCAEFHLYGEVGLYSSSPLSSPRPELSSPSQDHVQRGLSQSPIPNETVKTEKEKIFFFKTTYVTNDYVCDTRDSISSILR